MAAFVTLINATFTVDFSAGEQYCQKSLGKSGKDTLIYHMAGGLGERGVLL